MREIINPAQIENACVKIKCGNDHGTAFYMGSNLLITAYHVVLEYNEGINDVYLYDKQGELQLCKIHYALAEHDICILSTDELVNNYLPLQSSIIKIREFCNVVGFPQQGFSSIISLDGRVNKIQLSERSDFLIGGFDIDPNFDYEGLSGAPAIIDGKVVGIVLQQIDDKLAIISIEKIHDALTSAGLDVDKEYDYQDVPEEFKETVKASTPNYVVFEKINEAIGKDGQWLLLQGTPGSGKSTLIASYEPESDDIQICGKYFVKVPNDPSPSSLRTSTSFFLDWLENLSSKTLTGLPHPKSEDTFEKRISNLPAYFKELGNFYAEQKLTGIIAIDGLDEVDNLKEFLGILPLQLPVNLKILFSCSGAILPPTIKGLIKVETTVNVTPIDLGQCESFILREIGKNTLSIMLVQQLAAKSEGHPLYLKYLINYINLNELESDHDKIAEWIDKIPVISGDITNYYDSIWHKIFEIPDKLWIVIILSRLRESVEKEQLFKILPPTYQMGFSSYYSSIQYLLYGKEQIEIYHTSFKIYIQQKTQEQSTNAHDLIAANCINFPKHFFSINNLLYHQAQGSYPLNAVTGCDQTWADKCAIHHVSPDLIILDIKKIINVAIDQNRPTDVIRLLLLLQRIEFRYDSVFTENATIIAQALIAQKKYSAAIKYLVRDNILLVDNNDAILFLRMFYQYGATKEAHYLQDSVHAAFRRQFREAMDTDEGVSPVVFQMELNATTLFMNQDFNLGIRRFYELINILGQQRNDSEDAGEQDAADLINNVREDCIAWQNAYSLGQFGIFSPSTELAEHAGKKIDKQWAGMVARSLVKIKEINNYQVGTLEKTEQYKALVKDVEMLVEDYGYEQDNLNLKILFIGLYQDSKRSDLLIQILEKYVPNKAITTIKADNGVDPDYRAFHEIYFSGLVAGYLEEAENYPQIFYSNHRYKDWEPYLISLVRSISFLEGKLYRTQAEGNQIAKNKAITELRNVYSKIDFTFDERSYWDRAYAIPEDIMPIIYFKLIRLQAVFDDHGLKLTLENICKRSSIQLGLYSEGLRESLNQIAIALIEHNLDQPETAKILSIWKEHTLYGVLNRWERTPELLKIVELYAIIGLEDEAEKVFVNMLNTSMGPGWYKEAQFDMLNTALRMPLEPTQKSAFLQQYSGMLDYASGEMTFQNYIRYDKESFVGNIAKLGDLTTAIKYFQFELVPDPNTLIFNAEGNTIDAPRKGDGYHLGGRNITEQGGILGIIKNANAASPLLRWALAEIFVINDDTFRYAGNYAKQFAAMLNEIEKIGGIDIAEMCDFIAEIANSTEMKKDGRDFLPHFGDLLTEGNRSILQAALDRDQVNFKLTAVEKNDLTSTDKDDNDLQRFNDICASTIILNKTALTAKGLKIFNEQRISVFDNWSSESAIAKENLKKLFGSDNHVLSSLKPFINKYNTDSWHIASKLIWYLEDHCSPENWNEVHKILIEHFKTLVQPLDSSFDKYKWINSSNELKNSDDDLLCLLIWLLSYPGEIIQIRAYQTMLRLCKIAPECTISALIKETLSTEISFSAEKCSELILDLSVYFPDILIDFLKANPDDLIRLNQLNHFTIAKNYLDTAINLNRAGFKDLYSLISAKFPISIIVVGEVALEENYLDPIQDIIDGLNDLKILNRDFCETIIEKTKHYCGTATIKDYQRSDKYLTRSFNDTREYSGRFYLLLKFALNVAIMPRAEYSLIQDIYDLINE